MKCCICSLLRCTFTMGVSSSLVVLTAYFYERTYTLLLFTQTKLRHPSSISWRRCGPFNSVGQSARKGEFAKFNTCVAGLNNPPVHPPTLRIHTNVRASQ